MPSTEDGTEVTKNTYYKVESLQPGELWHTEARVATRQFADSYIAESEAYAKWRIIKVEEVTMTYPPEYVEPKPGHVLFAKWFDEEFGLTIEPTDAIIEDKLTIQEVYDELKWYLNEEDGINSHED